ncbi:MAG: peptidoglycan-binding protein [Clostridia bacterium]|nr:peptidoglycan-binding protein [Clostridia bacterium]
MKHLLRINSPIYNLQVFLRTISRKYPSIPDVLPDGVYGDATRNAVTAFQQMFNLNDDGVTDFSTWDHIVNVYKEIEKESVVNSVHIYPESGLNEEKPSFVPTIFIIQSMLLTLSDVFTNIPLLTVNGILDFETQEAVKAVQKVSGLNPDGRITPLFWNYLVAIYEANVSADRIANFSANVTV